MKRFFFLSFLILASLFSVAQTQQGFVKTKGRLDANGKLIPGQGLKGATVSVQGRTAVLVNNDDGKFSFPVTTEQFRLDSVRKKGYQLVDMEACPRTYKYSNNPLFIVMETPEQQLQDQLAAQRKIRRTLEKQLREREDEIEALKEQKKITDEEYRQALQKLYEDTDQNEQLVKDMVERYSKIDYDQLSKDDLLISNYILNGELTKADSLLRTKGNLDQRVSEYKKHEAINAKEREELAERQELLEQSEAQRILELDDLAKDLYHKFEIFKMQHENDSAAYFIELRANLDTTNAEWLYGAGDFNYDFAYFEKALLYFQSALREYIKQQGEKSESVSNIYNNIGSVYANQGDYDKALEYHNKALEIKKSVFGEFHPNTAFSYNNIGFVHSNQGDYDKALEYYNKALEIRKTTLQENNPYIAQSYNNVGFIYSAKGNYSKALENYHKALILSDTIQPVNAPYLSQTYHNIGSVYSDLGNYNKAIEYLNKALNTELIVYDENHPNVSMTYNNIGFAYYHLGNLEKAMEYFKKAAAVRRTISGKWHPQVAFCFNNIAAIYNKLGDNDKALEYNEKALSIRITYYGENHPYVAYCYNNLGYTYDIMGEKSKALTYYYKALSIRMATLENEHPLIAATFYNIGAVYSDLNMLKESKEYYEKALLIYSNKYGPEDSRTLKTQEKIFEIEAKMKETGGK